MPSPNEQIGPYTLVQQLGRGAFGVVWLAERRGKLATTQVALKLLLEEEPDMESIARESRVWAQAAGHPNIVPIIEAEVYDDHIVVVSEYAPDGSLQDWLDRNGGQAPSLDSAVRMTIGILDGLEHLHSKRIVHRDLKPANVLLQGETPRLADFGLARVLKGDTSSASIAGTPSYMAPEAFDGRRSERSDIWAAGVILHRLLTGRHPFPQGDMAALVGAIIARPPEPLPPTVPAPVRKVVARALQKDPALRFGSAAEMRDLLAQALSADDLSSTSMRTPVGPVAAIAPGATRPVAARATAPAYRSMSTVSGSLADTSQFLPPAQSRARALVVPAVILALLLGAGYGASRYMSGEAGAAESGDATRQLGSSGPVVSAPDSGQQLARPGESREAIGPIPLDAGGDTRTDSTGSRVVDPPVAPASRVQDPSASDPELVQSGPAPAPASRATSGGSMLDGTWQEQGGDCSGSTITISGGGASVSGVSNCYGIGSWTGRVVDTGPNWVMYEKSVGGQTVTCKIHVYAASQGSKQWKVNGKTGGSSTLVRTGG